MCVGVLQALGGALTPENSCRQVDGDKWMCLLCCALMSRRALKRHLDVVHMKAKRHACSKCGKLFGRNYLARQHESKCAVQSQAD